MNLIQFISIVRGRWKIAALILLLTVGTALTVSLLMPKQYVATATLVVDPSRPDPVAAAVYQGNPSPAYVATQVDVIKSERVALQVIRKLKLAEGPEAKADWMRATGGEGTVEIWKVQRLLNALEVKPSRESNVVSVSYKTDDAARAALMANAFVQAYLDVSLDLKVDPSKSYSEFFETRAKELRAAVEAAQAKLSQYQRDKGVIIASDGQLDVESARLNELSSQLVALQAVAAESSGRAAAAQGAGADRMAELINNPTLQAMNAEITRADAKLQELLSRFGDNHPQVIEAKANIASLKGRLAAEKSRVTGSVAVTSTVNRQREVEIRAALEAQRARVLKMRTAREEGAILVKDVENAQHNYEAVLARLNQSTLESHATQINAYVLAAALPPMLPASPKIIFNLVMAVVLGLVLGIGATILLEMIDRRVRTADEMSELLDLPILGVLPKPRGTGGFSDGRTQLLSPRGLFGQLPAPRREA